MARGDYEQGDLFSALNGAGDGASAEARADPPRTIDVDLGTEFDGKPLVVTLLMDDLSACLSSLMVANSNQGIIDAASSPAGFNGDPAYLAGAAVSLARHRTDALRHFARAAQVSLPAPGTFRPQDLRGIVGPKVCGWFGRFESLFAARVKDELTQREITARRATLDLALGRTATARRRKSGTQPTA